MAEQEVAAAKALGNAAFSAGDFAAAAELYSAALRHVDTSIANPQGLHVLHGNRAAARLKLQQWEGALQDAEAALAVLPGWGKGLYRRAAALQGLGRLPAALVAAQQAAAAEPGNPQVQQLLAQLIPAAEATMDGCDPDAAIKPAPTPAVLPPLLSGAPWEYAASPDGTDENLLLLLHGLGDRPFSFARLARQMALPQTAFLALGGPQGVPFSEEGGRSWFTSFTPDLDLIPGVAGEVRRIRSLAATVAALQQLLSGLRVRSGWRPHRVHLLGFSQGGTVALELARQQQTAGQPLGSCVAVSAALLPEQLALQQQQQRSPGPNPRPDSASTPVLLTHGSADTVLSRSLVVRTVEVLRSAHGMQASVHSVPGKAHAMVQGAEEMRQLMTFWASSLSRRPTAADLPPGAGDSSVAGGGQGFIEVRPGEVTLERA